MNNQHHFPARYLAEDLPRRIRKLAKLAEKTARRCAKTGSAEPAEELIRELYRCSFLAQEQVPAMTARLGVHERILELAIKQHDYDLDRARTDAVCGLVAEAVVDSFDPRGYFVYVLWGSHPEVPVYVGQSTNILARLGSHLGDKAKRTLVERVQLIRCRGQHGMNRLEAELIYKYNPTLNVSGTDKWRARAS